MMTLVFFLEEPSAKAMLQGLLPKIAPGVCAQYVVFEGKQDLEKRLSLRLRAWLQTESTRFIVMRDQDAGDCKAIKAALQDKCYRTGRTDVLIRIACHELESFYLGDLTAVAQAFARHGLAQKQQRSKYRTPDHLANPAEELKKLVPEYQKLSGSRSIAPYMDPDNNRSASFNALVQGIRRLLQP